MIGDNYKKDILGANNLNMVSFWYRNINNFEFNNDFEFNNYNNLLIYFKNVYNELVHLRKISKYCGERFDLVQAGGGNSSVKINDIMFIKASGYNMSNIKQCSGYVMVNNKELKKDIYDKNVKNIINYNIIGKLSGSIETYMHFYFKKIYNTFTPYSNK